MSHPQIASGLLRLVEDGGSHNSLIVQGRSGYVLFTGRRGDPTLTVQIAAGRQLDEGVQIDDAQHQRLYDRGFRRGTMEDNHALVLTLGGPDAAGALADEALAWLRQTYAEAGPPAVDFVPGEVDPTENARVLQLMTTLGA